MDKAWSHRTPLIYKTASSRPQNPPLSRLAYHAEKMSHMSEKLRCLRSIPLKKYADSDFAKKPLAWKFLLYIQKHLKMNEQ